MKQLIRTAAAATACAVALSAAPAGAEAIKRDSKERVVVEKICEWEVDANGKPILDAGGNPIPVKVDGKQVCKEKKVSSGSSSSASKWADDTTDELRIGAVVGVIGALLALVLGGGLLFIESVDITMLPPAR
ncbi:hypothetical protein HMPREF3151_03890 [Corynebacterium sp. HMSC05H05]|uniref:hypothetical protein n=1 Tax=Corynebacterium sp. HMSC05H05 TaxID=1581119 RepID=UPI0008A21E70|nr:hypothetical protein [Corynebacterium sp. HMSC05H05]OFT58627.1 hypothetical protein HMPREF3151_03890 [Corynebacterium sp. HMSC05H05]